jgi:hypothetical protein
LDSLVRNERLKLLAGALDRASTACLTVGAIAPLASLMFGTGALAMAPPWVAAGASSWLLAAAALHLFAREALGGLVHDRV